MIPLRLRSMVACVGALSLSMLAHHFDAIVLREYFATIAGLLASADVLRWIRGDKA